LDATGGSRFCFAFPRRHRDFPPTACSLGLAHACVSRRIAGISTSDILFCPDRFQRDTWASHRRGTGPWESLPDHFYVRFGSAGNIHHRCCSGRGNQAADRHTLPFARCFGRWKSSAATSFQRGARNKGCEVLGLAGLQAYNLLLTTHFNC